MSGVIYIITTGDEGYVGSTDDFTTRMSHHKGNIYNENSNKYNYKLYKTIRANDGEWEISIYEDNLSMTKDELHMREEEVRLLLGATLNGARAYATEEQIRQSKRDRNAKFSMVHIKCECGSIVLRGNKAAHKRTAKHARLMTSLSQT